MQMPQIFRCVTEMHWPILRIYHVTLLSATLQEILLNEKFDHARLYSWCIQDHSHKHKVRLESEQCHVGTKDPDQVFTQNQGLFLKRRQLDCGRQKKRKISKNIRRLQPLTCWNPHQHSYCLTLVARWDSGLALEFCKLSTLLSTSVCPGFPLWKMKSCHNYILEAEAVGCPNFFFKFDIIFT